MITVWLVCDGFFPELAFSSRFYGFLGEKDWTIAYCWLLLVYTPVNDTIQLIWITNENWDHCQILLPPKFSKSLTKFESSNHSLRLHEFMDLPTLTHVNIWLLSSPKVLFIFLFPDTWNHTTDWILLFPMFGYYILYFYKLV